MFPCLDIASEALKTCDHLPLACEKSKKNQVVLSFGSACSEREIPAGRTGYCQFMPVHIRSMSDFADGVARDLQTKKSVFKETKRQFIVADGDIVVSNRLTAQIVASFQ